MFTINVLYDLNSIFFRISPAGTWDQVLRLSDCDSRSFVQSIVTSAVEQRTGRRWRGCRYPLAYDSSPRSCQDTPPSSADRTER